MRKTCAIDFGFVFPIVGDVNCESTRCCPDCFTSEAAQTFIERQGSQGRCSFCEHGHSLTIAPIALQDLFRPLVTLFEVPRGLELHYLTACEPHESNLAEQIVDVYGFEVFSNGLSVEKQCALLDYIRGLKPGEFGNPSAGPWGPSLDHAVSHGDGYAWHTLAEYLKTKRRFIIRPELMGVNEGPEKWIRDIISKHGVTHTLKPNVTLYRARLGGAADAHEFLVPHPAAEMGPPPANKSSPGRANPRGIPYLYAATKPETAIAEIRPEIGASVTVRPVQIEKDIVLVDLSEELAIKDPIGIKKLNESVAAISLLNALRHQLSRPVLDSDSELEYLPSQYLTEVILEAGFGGVLYPSSQAPTGRNIVIFDSTGVSISDLAELRYVESVSYRSKTIS